MSYWSSECIKAVEFWWAGVYAVLQNFTLVISFFLIFSVVGISFEFKEVVNRRIEYMLK